MSDFSITVVKADVTATLLEMGVKAPRLDGRFHRFGKKLEKSYIGRATIIDGIPYTFCRVFDFSENESWQVQHSEENNPRRMQSELKKFNKVVMGQFEDEERTRHEEERKNSLSLWQAASNTGVSEYFKTKQIEEIQKIDDFLRYSDGVVYINMVDNDDKMWSFQRIFNDGRKRYKGKKKGLVHIINNESCEMVYICEGYATGASIALATGSTVVVGFDANNLEDATYQASRRFPESQLVIAADNDQWKKKENSPSVNTGLAVATKVGQKFKIPVVYPVFLDEHETAKPTDFNDLRNLMGEVALLDQLEFESSEEGSSFKYNVVHSEDGELSIKELAIKVMDRYQLISDYSGLVYQYNGRFWHGLPENKLRKIIGSEDNMAMDKPSRRDNVKKEIVDYALLDDVDSSMHPSGIPWRQLPNNGDCVVFRNGVYSLGDGKLYPNRPEHYVDAVIPHRYNPAAKCPTWMRCLEEWFGDSLEERAIALKQFFGYVILPHAKYKKALICFGPPNTGKSAIGKILTMLVGDKGFCSLGFEQMDKSEALVQVKGKYLNLISEPDKQSLINDGNFKKLVSTGEAVTIRHLYHPAETYTPFAKHVILCNTLPRWNDETNATEKRLLLVEFDRIFADHEQDPGLEDKLAAEMEGIVNWALEGSMQIKLMQGRFSQPESSKKVLEQHSIEQNPALSFFYENCVVDASSTVSAKYLFGLYKDDNRSSKMGMATFKRLLSHGGFNPEGPLGTIRGYRKIS